MAHLASTNLYLILITAIAATSGLLFGFDTGNIAGALIYIEKEFDTTTFQNQLIVSVTILGAFLSALLSGKLADWLGRKQMLMIAGILFCLGAVIAAQAATINMLILGRLLLGVAIGISSFTAPLYISELAPATHRGALVLLNGLALTFGECVAFLSDYFLSFTQNWRLMIFLGIIPAIILLVGMIFMPSSPRWLMVKKQKSKAIAVLQKIRQTPYVMDEIRNIERTLKVQSSNILSIWMNKRWRLAISVGLLLGVLQQFSGINAIMYYGPYVFQKAGFESHSVQIFATFILGFVNMVMTLVTVLVVDRVGRKPLLQFGFFLAAFSLLLLASVHLFEIFPDQVGYMSVVLLMLFMIGYCMGIGSLFWLIISEIFPLEFRGAAMGFVTAIQWVANFAVSISFLTLLDKLSISGVFLVFSLTCFWGAWFSRKYVQETKGLSLEQIENNNSLRV